MASVKVILRSKANKKGEHPLALQIIKDRKSSIIHLGHHILEKDWDEVKQRVKKSHPNSGRLNAYIGKRLTEATEKLLELQSAGRDNSARTIRKVVKSGKAVSFFDQAQIHLDNLKNEGKYNRLTTDGPKVNRLREFIGSDAPFSDIDTELLKRFKAWLKGSRGVSERTAVNHLVVVRSIFNQAISSGLVDRKHYPFGKGKIIIKFPDTIKVGLSAEEVHLLENIELTALEHHARNLWLFSLYTAGMRISDVLRLRWSDIHGERLHYSMGKNNKAGSIKLPDKALKLLEAYRRDGVLVFHDLEGLEDLNSKFEVQRRIKSRLHDINERLKAVAAKAGVKKRLTMHLARHTFAQLAGDKISPQILQTLYRHTSIVTTMQYQGQFTNEKTDKALDTVLDF